MMKFPVVIATSVIAVILILITSTVPSALSDGDGFSLFGKAKKVKDPLDPENKVVRLRSTCPTGSPACFSDGTFTFSGISFKLGANDNDNDNDNNDDDNSGGGLTFADITKLSTDYFIETDDDCFGGSPRFQINVDTDGDGDFDGNIHVHIGPSPSFTGCTTGSWQSTGNLIGNEDTGRYDASSVGGGVFSTYSAVLAHMATLSNHQIIGFQLVVDSSWGFADGEQTIFVDNFEVDTSSGEDDNDNNDD